MQKRKTITQLLKEYDRGIRLDLGGGAVPQPDFINIDKRDLPQVHIVHDLEKFPWPLPNECCSVIMASHLVEHINPHGGIFINFMNEAWRIMKPKGKFMISHPYGVSSLYVGDPTHCNPCNDRTWIYFDPLSSQDPNGQLFSIYEPKPWKIEYTTWRPDGNMEVILSKRIINKRYAK